MVTSDAITRDGQLNLMELPEDLKAQIDTKLPPRWSKGNPVDCAGGETRDTIPEVLEMIAVHPDVHAVIYLGIGIQSNQARLLRELWHELRRGVKAGALHGDRLLLVAEVKFGEVVFDHESDEFFELSNINHGCGCGVAAWSDNSGKPKSLLWSSGDRGRS